MRIFIGLFIAFSLLSTDMALGERYGRRTYRGTQPSSRALLSVQMGMLGRQSSVPSDLLGVQPLLGALVSVSFAAGPHWLVRPTVGYFYSNQGESQVSVVQNVLNVGMDFLKVISHDAGSHVHLGLQLMGEGVLSNINISPQVSAVAAPGLRVRAGPVVGFRRSISGSLHWVGDLAVTTWIELPIRLHLTATTGLAFPL